MEKNVNKSNKINNEKVSNNQNKSLSKSAQLNSNKNSKKSFIATLLFAIFFGFLGVHRFYAGKVATGLIWLFTFGVFGIGYVADIIVITSQTFEDVEGKIIGV